MQGMTINYLLVFRDHILGRSDDRPKPLPLFPVAAATKSFEYKILLAISMC